MSRRVISEVQKFQNAGTIPITAGGVTLVGDDFEWHDAVIKTTYLIRQGITHLTHGSVPVARKCASCSHAWPLPSTVGLVLRIIGEGRDDS